MRPWYRQIDWVLILAWAGLVAVSLVAIYSTTHGRGAEYLPGTMRENTERQAFFFLASIVALLVCLTRSPRFFHNLAWPAYLLGLALITATAAIGEERNGAKAWLALGGVGFQPAELAKLGTVMAVASLLAGRNPKGKSLRYAIGAVVLLLIPAAITIAGQNDTGTGLVFLGLIPIVLFWSGLPLHILALMLAPAVAGYFAVVLKPAAYAFALLFTFGIWIATRQKSLAIVAATFTLGVTVAATLAIGFLQPHQQARIVSFTNPEAEQFKDNVGYHLVQSKAAIGSGGLTGKGFMQGTQTQGAYIPEQSTDFVFSIIGEEWGFLGSLVVLGLYGLLLGRLVKLGAQMRSPFGSLVAAGAAGVFLIHLFINLGMVTGLLPVIGIPLPFMSYGGTALLANSLMLAIVFSMHMRRDDFSVYGL
ncbi:MAG TPA: rod shape-determining protein RodA [Rhodothermales bacterium]|nr:rod shape-determining protein RodA [Rhodothermales bacterium]